MSHARTAAGARLLLALLLSVLFALGCDSETAPEDAPEGHGVVEDGVAHMSGLENPTENCVACHGDTLEGGSNGEPSCFSCHGREW